MHVTLLSTHLVVISDALQSDSTTHLLLHQLTDVELYQVLAARPVKVQKLFLHRSRASYDMRTLLFTNLQSTGESLFVMIKDIIDLVNSHKLTVLQVEVTPLVALHKRLRHGYNDVPWLVSFLIHPSDCKMQLLGLFILSKLLVLGQDTLEGILKHVGVYDNYALWHEYLVLLYFSLELFVFGSGHAFLDAV